MGKILITGGSSGLGFSLAKEYIARGKEVIIVGRNREKLDEAKKELGEKAHICVGDISKKSEVEGLFKYFLLNNIKIGKLVNNAGYGSFSRVEDLSYVEVDKVIDTNLKGGIYITSEFIKYRKGVEGRGELINILSTTNLTYKLEESIYSASKRGFEAFLKIAELEEENMDFYYIYPGGMATEFWEEEKDTSAFMNPNEIATKTLDFLDENEGNTLILKRKN